MRNKQNIDLVKKTNSRTKNALKHGLLSKEIVMNLDNVRPFNRLAKQLMAELKPENTLEVILAEQIIVNYWRLRGFLKLENEILLFAGKPKWSLDRDREFISLFTDFVGSNPSLDLLTRYNASILRSFYRSINEYRNLKNSNKAN